MPNIVIAYCQVHRSRVMTIDQFLTFDLDSPSNLRSPYQSLDRLGYVGFQGFIEVLRRLIDFHTSGSRYLNSSTQIHCLVQFSAHLDHFEFFDDVIMTS